MNARAVWFRGPRDVEVREEEVPELAEGELLVRTRYSGICGEWELRHYRGVGGPYPLRGGCSCAGRVERSRGSLPEGALVVALHPHQDVFVVAERDVVTLENEKLRTATLVPLADTAMRLCESVGARAGHTVGVLGLSPLGILVGALLLRSGVEVLASDALAWRRAAAECFDLRVMAPDELEAALSRAEEAGRRTLLLAPAGVATGLRRALDGVRPAELSAPADDGDPAVRRANAHRMGPVLRSILAELSVSKLATHDFPFERAADAYAALDQGEEGMLHAALHYP